MVVFIRKRYGNTEIRQYGFLTTTPSINAASTIFLFRVHSRFKISESIGAARPRRPTGQRSKTSIIKIQDWEQALDFLSQCLLTNDR